MNIIRKLFARKRPICCMHGGSKIHATGSICNLQNNPSAIKLGDHTHIRGELLVFRHGGTISMGDFCYLGEGARIWSSAEVIIGMRVLISHLVSIYDNTLEVSSPKYISEYTASYIKETLKNSPIYQEFHDHD